MKAVELKTRLFAMRRLVGLLTLPPRFSDVSANSKRLGSHAPCDAVPPRIQSSQHRCHRLCLGSATYGSAAGFSSTCYRSRVFQETGIPPLRRPCRPTFLRNVAEALPTSDALEG